MQPGPAPEVTTTVAPAPTHPPSVVEAPNFHVSENSNIFGPFTMEEINKKLRSRSLSLDASILNPSDNSWVIISEFPSVIIPVYHIARGNEKFGPYTHQEVMNNYESGSLNDEDMILDPDTNSWQTIGEWDGVKTKQYYVQHQLGETQGPYTIPKIVELLNNGSLDASDFISTDNSEWMPMSTCSHLGKATFNTMLKRSKERYKRGGWGGGDTLFAALAMAGFLATGYVYFALFLSKEEIGLTLWNLFAVITWYIFYLKIVRKITNHFG